MRESEKEVLYGFAEHLREKNYIDYDVTRFGSRDPVGYYNALAKLHGIEDEIRNYIKKMEGR